MLLTGLLLVPLFSAIILAVWGSHPIAKYLNTVCSLLILCFAITLGWQFNQQGNLTYVHGWFYIDALNIFIIILTSVIGFTTSVFGITYLSNERAHGKLTLTSLRFYHSLYQFFLFAALLILTTNNLGIIWVAMEGATLSTVLLVGLNRMPESLEAAWKYLILCGVGLAQALLGIILLYFAAERVMNSHDALFLTHLHAVSSQLSPRIAAIAFVFILVGYGTKVGFVPLHNWLPDAYGEGIAPVQALLSGILLNAAFYTILRCKIIVDGAVAANFTNHFLLGFGILNIFVAAFFLLRQREIRRLFAYSSIEHVGLISFAFGLGAPLAILAGMLHIIAHSLSKTAVFFCTGQIIQTRNTSIIEHIRGLIHDYPLLGWGFLFSSVSLLGLPPFALFTSEFLILLTTIKSYPILTALLVIGLGISFAAILFKTQAMIFTDNPSTTLSHEAISMMPVYLHLLLLLLLGLLTPVYLMDLANQIAHMLLRIEA